MVDFIADQDETKRDENQIDSQSKSASCHMVHSTEEEHDEIEEKIPLKKKLWSKPLMKLAQSNFVQGNNYQQEQHRLKRNPKERQLKKMRPQVHNLNRGQRKL